MKAQPLSVTPEAARAALLEYKQHRNKYDARDWEIEKLYRRIAKGQVVISAFDAIRQAGIDELGRPRLALMRADQERATCWAYDAQQVRFVSERGRRGKDFNFEIDWPNRARTNNAHLQAALPRIPPQHRPAQEDLHKYHLLWEADWKELPRDPFLLKRVAHDAWVVLAAWDLTDVEMSVLRSR